jgi:hypothetical protein
MSERDAKVSKETRELIRTMSHENAIWGVPRIRSELLKLGIKISEATVAKYMVRHQKPPSQTWKTFLHNHVSQLASIDFFTVHTIWFEILFVFIVLAHDRRRVVHFNVITIGPAFISLWIKIRSTRDPCNPWAESSRLPKSVGCTIATSASPNKFSTVDSSNVGRIVSKPIDGRYRSERVDNFKPSSFFERAALAISLHSSMPKQSLTRFSVSTG